MPWKETDPMTERLRCIAANLNQVYSMIDLCERFGIRRHTGYKGVRRYTAPGLAGLQEKSRAPHRCSHRMSEQPCSEHPGSALTPTAYRYGALVKITFASVRS
jgi:putative transposase